MTKEQIDELFWGHGIEFYPDGMCKRTHFTRVDFEDLIEQVWNQAIQTAADNADADFMCLVSEDEEKIKGMFAKGNLEVYVIKESVLKLKM